MEKKERKEKGVRRERGQSVAYMLDFFPFFSPSIALLTMVNTLPIVSIQSTVHYPIRRARSRNSLLVTTTTIGSIMFNTNCGHLHHMEAAVKGASSEVFVAVGLMTRLYLLTIDCLDIVRNWYPAQYQQGTLVMERVAVLWG